jgi:hypothetical protein
MVSTASIYNLPFKILLTIRNFGDCLHLKTYNGNLYVGTNQGLFYKKYQTSDEFKFISGTKGQVWSLFEQEGTLCGHDSGTL